MAEIHWTAYLTSLMTPIVACFGLWIARQQWVTARDKLRLDLYERRMAIYKVATEALGTIFRHGQLKSEDERNYLVGVAGSQWLFGKDVTQYLEKELWGKFCEFHGYIGELKGLEPGPERNALVQKQAELRKWFLAQSDRMELLFLPYMVFPHRSISLKFWER